MVRGQSRDAAPKTTLRQRLAAAALVAFVGLCTAALLWLVRGFDFVLLGSAFAAGGAVLGFCFGPRVGYFLIYSARHAAQLRIDSSGESAHSMDDAELGALTWNEQLGWWEGAIRMTSPEEFELFVFARPSLVADRSITADARAAIARIRTAEAACRSYGCGELLDIHNSEWSEGSAIDAGEFERRLQPDSVQVHESGYSEVHFRDGNLFYGHSVCVRIRPDGSFQEAVVAG